MKIKTDMSRKDWGILMWIILTALTVSLYMFQDMPEYPSKALPFIWCFFSWNYYAYAFNKRMWPPQFDELHGDEKGIPGWRAFWFWFSVLMYGALLGTVAWN